MGIAINTIVLTFFLLAFLSLSLFRLLFTQSHGYTHYIASLYILVIFMSRLIFNGCSYPVYDSYTSSNWSHHHEFPALAVRLRLLLLV